MSAPANSAPDAMPYSASLLALRMGVTKFVAYQPEPEPCLMCDLGRWIFGRYVCRSHRRTK